MALFFAALNILLGMQAAGAGNDWKTGYGFLVSVIIVSFIVLEVLAYLKRKEHSLPPTFQMDSVREVDFPSSNLPKGTFFPWLIYLNPITEVEFRFAVVKDSRILHSLKSGICDPLRSDNMEAPILRGYCGLKINLYVRTPNFSECKILWPWGIWTPLKNKHICIIVSHTTLMKQGECVLVFYSNKQPFSKSKLQITLAWAELLSFLDVDI